jgi:hypothetical protein
VCYQLPFCFTQFVVEVTFNFILSAFVFYCYRAALPSATKIFPTMNFFWPVDVHTQCSSGYKKNILELLPWKAGWEALG